MGVVTQTLEWWPDYCGGTLWKTAGRGGRHVDSAALGLHPDLAARLVAWNQRYAEDKLPVTSEGDPEWLGEGIRLLAEVRRCLAGRFDVAVSEPWWGEEPRG